MLKVIQVNPQTQLQRHSEEEDKHPKAQPVSTNSADQSVTYSAANRTAF